MNELLQFLNFPIFLPDNLFQQTQLPHYKLLTGAEQTLLVGLVQKVVSSKRFLKILALLMEWVRVVYHEVKFKFNS